MTLLNECKCDCKMIFLPLMIVQRRRTEYYSRIFFIRVENYEIGFQEFDIFLKRPIETSLF